MGEQNLVPGVDSETVAAAFVDERVARNRFHRLHIDRGHAADRVLHDVVQYALAVSYTLLGVPPRSALSRTVPSLASMTVASLVGWLKA